MEARTVESFRIDVPQASLDDLDRRLASIRWPGDIDNDAWRYGTPRAYLEELVDYWRHQYDWRSHEAAMNELPHFRTEIDGYPIHFIHVRGKGPNPMPIVCTHGWPWSFWDLRGLIGPLTDPVAHGFDGADSFDVVIPSLPGFTFSTPLPVGHFSTRDVAGLWVKLMQDVLGYGTFCAQGGDWGAHVCTELGHAFADRIHGIQITMPAFNGIDRENIDPADCGPGEEDYEARTRARLAHAKAHSAVQGTDPQSLAYAMHDSPSGLLAWLVERRRNWSDCEDPEGNRDVERRFSKDELLTLTSLYWHTDSFWSCLRIYYGRFSVPWQPAHGRSPIVEAPTALAVFPGDLIFTPRRTCERVANIARWSLQPAGGHFAAAEEPSLVASEVREFFRQFRT